MGKKNKKKKKSSQEVLIEMQNLIINIETLPFTSKESKEIVEALRFGIPPKKGLKYLTVGRNTLIKKMSDNLKLVADGSSRFIFLKGNYGSGKTHMLRILQEYAHNESFSSSLVELSSRECPLDNLGLIYRKVVQNLQVNEYSNGFALESILSTWAEHIRKVCDLDRRLAIRQLSNLDKNFCAALTAYYSGKLTTDSTQTNNVLEWLLGNNLSKNELINLRLSENITDQNALSMLGNFSKMLKYLGRKGICILFDEADRAISFENIKKRSTAIRNLNILMQSSREFPSSYFIYSTPPEFFDQKDILRNISLDHCEFIELGQLEAFHLKELSKKIRNLHIKAYDWDNIFRANNTELLFLVETLLKNPSIKSTLRSFVRSTIQVLDLLQQYPKLNLINVLDTLNLSE